MANPVNNPINNPEPIPDPLAPLEMVRQDAVVRPRANNPVADADDILGVRGGIRKTKRKSSRKLKKKSSRKLKRKSTKKTNRKPRRF